MTNEEKLIEVAEAAHIKRAELVQLYKAQKRGNVKIALPYNFDYVYGETIKEPQIVFPSGQTMTDWEFFSKTIWLKPSSLSKNS